MDPLSISASIAGLLTVAGEIGKILGPYMSAARELPPIASRVYSEVEESRIVLAGLQKFTNSIDLPQTRHVNFIKVNQVVALLTGAVLVFSELQAIVDGIMLTGETTRVSRLQTRLQWAARETKLNTLLERLQAFKVSMSLIFNILQCDTDLHAFRGQTELEANIGKLLASNKALSARLERLEDNLATASVDFTRRIVFFDRSSARASTNSLFSTARKFAGFDFELELQVSRVYRRAIRNSIDISFQSSLIRSQAWSIFSGPSLQNISMLSVIALPIYPRDISNSQHYDFGGGSQIHANIFEVTSRQDEKIALSKSILLDAFEVHRFLLQIPAYKQCLRGAGPRSFLTDPFTQLRYLIKRVAPYLMQLEKWEDPFMYFRPSDEWYYVEKHHRNDFTKLFDMEVPPGVDDLSIEDDDARFLMVIDVLHRLLPHLVTKGILKTPDVSIPLPPLMISRRRMNSLDYITREFIENERHKMLSSQKISDVQSTIRLHNLPMSQSFFAPFTSLARCQARFLRDMEINFYKPYSEQQWARVFTEWRLASDHVAKTLLGVEGLNVEDHLSSILPQATYVTARVAKELEVRLQAISEALRNQERLKTYENSLRHLITRRTPLQKFPRILPNETMASQAQDIWSVVAPCCGGGAGGLRLMSQMANKLEDGLKMLSSALATARLLDWDPKYVRYHWDSSTKEWVWSA